MSSEYFPAGQQELWDLIEERANDESDSTEVDRRIWDRFGTEGAIVFTDLKGFTRRSEEYGITHFLETVLRSQQLLRPIIATHNGIAIDVVADSMMIWFDDLRDSLNCSIAMQNACQEFNVGKPPANQVLLSVGIGYGPTLKVGNVRLAGSEVNVASKLGEDTAEGYEILVSTSVQQNTGTEGFEFLLTGISFPGSAEVYRVSYQD
jgi:adenylate cyclase